MEVFSGVSSEALFELKDFKNGKYKIEEGKRNNKRKCLRFMGNGIGNDNKEINGHFDAGGGHESPHELFGIAFGAFDHEKMNEGCCDKKEEAKREQKFRGQHCRRQIWEDQIL